MIFYDILLEENVYGRFIINVLFFVQFIIIIQNLLTSKTYELIL